MPELIETRQYPSEVSEEPYLVTENRGKLTIFKRFGLFLVHWKGKKYDTSNRWLLFYYLLTYIAGLAIGGLAFGMHRLLKDNIEQDRIHDLIEASFYGIFLGIAPSFWIYLLKEIGTYLPQILALTKTLENTEIYKKLGYSTKVSYMEGYLDSDHSDECDNVYNDETKENVKQMWWIVKYGPLVGMIMSVSTCTILTIVSFFWDPDKEIHASFDPFKQLDHHFIVAVLYPIPSFVSIWFCIFFLEWQRKVYSHLRQHIRNIGKANTDERLSPLEIRLTEESKKEFVKVWEMLNKLQKVFILLNKKIFQKTLVHAFTVFIIVSIFCCCKLLQDYQNFLFMFPLSLIMSHLYFVCKWSNDLMGEYNEIIEVLDEINEEHVQDIRRELNECPPQVKAFGGFNTDYGMMTAIIAFMLSIISISGMIWPDLHKQRGQDIEQCYQYQDTTGERNHSHTLCVNKHCYNYTGETGIWNQTLCIVNKINEKLFINGTLIDDFVIQL